VRLHRKYVSIARTSLSITFVYRAGFALNMVGSIFYVVAMFYLWQTIFLGSPGALSGFTWPQMKAYLLVAFLLNSLMTWYAEWNMSQDLREGRVATDLARPMDFQASRLASAIGPVPFEFCSAIWSALSSRPCSAGSPCRPTRSTWLFSW
jgi:ABC-2 type transport system permease protein